MKPLQYIWNSWDGTVAFSCVFSVLDENGVVFQTSAGSRNISEQLPCTPDTAFGIASGTKLLTGIAVCKLIEAGKLHLDDSIWDILPYDLGQIDRRVTLRHLLTHTSGIGDYLDEDADDYDKASELLAAQYPLYLWETLSYYLPMITPLAKKFAPGERFGYSNAGFVLLGLAVEAAAKVAYQPYVTDEILTPLQLTHTGFYRMDSLPFNTALGYVENEAGGIRTNHFKLPVIGGADGGLYSCAKDMNTLWRALMGGHILSAPMLETVLTPHVKQDDEHSYGLGIYRLDRNGQTAYYIVGADAGVSFISVYFPRRKHTATILNNTEYDIFSLSKLLFKEEMA
ncbi:MAG: beta-lactamase family protein [Firmicutes bacterium]|nr:beta-lactamase family protein [Bacillota bacterium]